MGKIDHALVRTTLLANPEWSYARVGRHTGACMETVRVIAKRDGIKRRICEPGEQRQSKSSPNPSSNASPVSSDNSTIYASIGPPSGEELSYLNIYKTARKLTDGIYEVVPPDTPDVSQWSYLCVHNGISHNLINPYATIPIKEEHTLASFTYLVHRNLEAQSAKHRFGG